MSENVTPGAPNEEHPAPPRVSPEARRRLISRAREAVPALVATIALSAVVVAIVALVVAPSDHRGNPVDWARATGHVAGLALGGSIAITGAGESQGSTETSGTVQGLTSDPSTEDQSGLTFEQGGSLPLGPDPGDDGVLDEQELQDFFDQQAAAASPDFTPPPSPSSGPDSTSSSSLGSSVQLSSSVSATGSARTLPLIITLPVLLLLSRAARRSTISAAQTPGEHALDLAGYTLALVVPVGVLSLLSRGALGFGVTEQADTETGLWPLLYTGVALVGLVLLHRHVSLRWKDWSEGDARRARVGHVLTELRRALITATALSAVAVIVYYCVQHPGHRFVRDFGVLIIGLPNAALAVAGMTLGAGFGFNLSLDVPEADGTLITHVGLLSGGLDWPWYLALVIPLVVLTVAALRVRRRHPVGQPFTAGAATFIVATVLAALAIGFVTALRSSGKANDLGGGGRLGLSYDQLFWLALGWASVATVAAAVLSPRLRRPMSGRWRALLGGDDIDISWDQPAALSSAPSSSDDDPFDGAAEDLLST